MTARNATFPNTDPGPIGHPWLSAFVEAIDTRLRRRNGVFEYTHSPQCIFRMAIGVSDRDVALADGTFVRRGSRIVDLHLWSEQVPVFPPGGPTLAWARRINHAVDVSLSELARYLDSRPDLDDVTALRGYIVFGSAEQTAQIAHVAERYGFERIPLPEQPSIAEKLHRFGQNILISMMVLARNAAALHANTLARDRILVFLSRRVLQQRYGRDDSGKAA